MAILDINSARILVYHIVVDWLGPKLNLSPDQVDVTFTFRDPRPTGYGMIAGSFLSMCDDIVTSLQVSSGRALTLPQTWRLQHQGDVIANFINSVAIRLAAAAMTKTGVQAMSWAVQS